jgi:outer membrane receptor protein involved in Fe transport
VLGREKLTDYGFYSQVVYGFRKGWTTGVRYDYVTRDGKGEYEQLFGLDPLRDRRWRVAPMLTWYPTEFSRVRLQYNLDDRQNLGQDHSIWLQMEFILGAHAAHKF